VHSPGRRYVTAAGIDVWVSGPAAASIGRKGSTNPRSLGFHGRRGDPGELCPTRRPLSIGESRHSSCNRTPIYWVQPLGGPLTGGLALAAFSAGVCD
jgi:hypothetical protein